MILEKYLPFMLLSAICTPLKAVVMLSSSQYTS